MKSKWVLKTSPSRALIESGSVVNRQRRLSYIVRHTHGSNTAIGPMYVPRIFSLIYLLFDYIWFYSRDMVDIVRRDCKVIYIVYIYVYIYSLFI